MPDEKTKVQVYINEFERTASRSKFDGYKNGDPLRLAVEFETYQVANVQRLLDATFEALNSPSPAPLGTLTVEAIASYHRLYPSLSLGDVVVVDGNAWTVASFGFDQVPLPMSVRPPLPFEPTREAKVIADCSKNWAGPAIAPVAIQKLAFLLTRDPGLRRAWDILVAQEQQRLAADLASVLPPKANA